MTFVPPTGTDDSPVAAPSSRLRASDADRAAIATVLQEAVARGLLSHDEGAERMTAAYSARYTDQLPPLTDDLPPAADPAAAPITGWRPLGSALLTQVRHEISLTATAGVRSRRFMVAVLSVIALLAVLLAVGEIALDDFLE